MKIDKPNLPIGIKSIRKKLSVIDFDLNFQDNTDMKTIEKLVERISAIIFDSSQTNHL